MKINLNAIRTLGGRAVLKLRKISPELALVGGIGLGAVAIVTACLATRKVDAVLEETHEELDQLQGELMEATDEKDADAIKDIKKDTVKCYLHAGWRLTKLYAPAMASGIGSVGLILASHGILKKRYLGLAAAYTTLDEAFKDYQKRVGEVIGADAGKFLANGLKAEKDITVEKDDGSTEKLSGHQLVASEHKASPYEFDFNRHTAPYTWDPNPEYSEAFLRNVQNYANDLLKSRGHIFLNEVLDELGMARTPAGALVGWVKNCGDNYVDFGYQECFDRDWRTDSDLCRKNIHLNFNVDGVIYDMI